MDGPTDNSIFQEWLREHTLLTVPVWVDWSRAAPVGPDDTPVTDSAVVAVPAHRRPAEAVSMPADTDPERIEGASGTVSGPAMAAAFLTALNHIGDTTGRIADGLRGKDAESVASPYLNAKEAAAYLRTTVKGIYGRVERGQLRRCPGSRELLFTREMLDESAEGNTKRTVRPREGR